MAANPKSELYEKLLPTLQVLEKERLEASQKGKKGFRVALMIAAPCIALLVAIFGPILFEPEAFIFPILIGLIATFAIAYAVQASYWRKFHTLFKHAFISRLVSAFDENLTYSHLSTFTKDEFNAAQLFDKRAERFSSHDMIVGKVGETRIRFAEVHAQYEHKDSKGESEWRTIFGGFFYEMDFNKSFRGKTLVLPDFDEAKKGKLVAQWFQSRDGRRGELIKLEDPEFERHFKVYGTNQIEARYILSPSLMRRILEYHLKMDREIQMCFRGGKLIVAISCSAGFLEADPDESLLQPEAVEKHLVDLRLAVGIVEELNLNRRIWESKGSPA